MEMPVSNVERQAHEDQEARLCLDTVVSFLITVIRIRHTRASCLVV